MESAAHTHFEQLLKRLLRPLVSILIKNSLQYRRFCELLKDVYVDVALSEFGKRGRPTNTTRIALLTGLDRKEVKRIRQQKIEASEEFIPTQTGALARVLTAWHQDPAFSQAGTPQPLEIDDGFATLCKQYGGDITRTAILKELHRVKAIRSLQNGDVVAQTRYYMPEQTDTEAVVRALDVYRDIGQTIVSNLYRSQEEVSRFEGRASNPSIPVAHVGEFREFIEQEGQQFLERVDQQLSHYEQHNNADQATVRLGMGLYWIESDVENKK